MSDFFYELAAKNLGTADVIVPRLSSRFESESLHSQLRFESESLMSLDDTNPGQPNRRTPQINHVSEQGEHNHSDSKPISFDRVQTSERSEGGKPGPPIHPTSRKVDAEIDVRQVPSPAATQNAGTHELVASPAGTTTERRSVHEITVRPRSSIDESVQTERGKKEPPAETKIIAKPQILVSDNSRKETPTSRTTTKTGSKHVADENKTAEVPTVNISIGRVEVRAVPSAVPTRAVATKPQTLSLDEYLQKRRNGGAR